MRMRLCRDEVGEYYAIDIGGTNFRSIHVTLSGNKGEVVRVHSSLCAAALPAHHLDVSEFHDQDVRGVHRCAGHMRPWSYPHRGCAYR